MNLKSKKILVTGGSGFIGTNLIKRMETLNANVFNFDISNGSNILHKKSLEKIVRQKFDVVFHLAGFSGSRQSNENIEKSFKINTFATINLFELISKYSPDTKIIFSSSRLEYGPVKYLPVDENHPVVPSSAYGLSKLAATQMALIYFKKNGLRVTVFRTSNVYGPHSESRFPGYNIINYFVDLAKKNKALTIFGDGSQSRDYLYIDDLIDAFLLGISKNSDGEIYNLGLGKGIKFKDMASQIIKRIGSGRIVFKDWPSDYLKVETGSYISDIRKIKSKLGFLPQTSIEEGIKKVISQL